MSRTSQAQDVSEDVLRELPMFSDLSQDTLTTLSKCTALVNCARGEFLFNHGDTAESFFILKSGRVKMRKFSPTGHEVILHLVSPPHMIGCRALTKNQNTPYPADAIAIDHVQALRFSRERFLKAVVATPEVFFGLLIDLNLRLLEVFNLKSVQMEPVEQRIAALLFYEALPKGKEPDEWESHPLKEVRLTKSVIGSIVGTSTETAIRVLSKWKKEGWITSERGITRIEQPQKIYEVYLGDD